MGVEVPVGDVVDGAPGAPHQKGAEDEYYKVFYLRLAARGDEERPERGPQHKERALLLREPYQLCDSRQLVFRHRARVHRPAPCLFFKRRAEIISGLNISVM